MARSENQRLKMLYLRDYLLENTDKEHTVNASDIIEHFKNKHNIPISQNTVYTDIQLLGYEPINSEYAMPNSYGMEIEYDYEKRGYKVIRREFELYEVQLLVDAIQSNKFVTQKIAKKISGKLKKFVSKHERKTLDRQNYVPNRIRSMNDSVFYGIDDIHASIANNRKISFRYFTYTVKKEKSYRKKGGVYIVSPFSLMWNDNNYYLIAYEGKRIKHFRVDKMDNIKALDEEREGEDAFKALNLSDRATKIFSMYGGKEERVGLRFHNHLVGVVLDRFGKGIIIMPDGQDHFIVNVAVEVSPQFFGWICGLKRGVKIISPDTVVKQMGEYVSSIAEMYQTDPKTQDSNTDT